MGELQSVDLGQPTRIIVSVFRHTAKLLSGPDLKLQIPYTLTLTTDPGYVVRDAMLNMPLAPLGTYSQPLHTHSSSAPALAAISECVRECCGRQEQRITEGGQRIVHVPEHSAFCVPCTEGRD